MRDSKAKSQGDPPLQRLGHRQLIRATLGSSAPIAEVQRHSRLEASAAESAVPTFYAGRTQLHLARLKQSTQQFSVRRAVPQVRERALPR